jgi:maleylpyruvate isomerase
VTEPVLHGYFRSSASFRVRAALNLKGIGYEDAFHHLGKGDQHASAFLSINPQGLVPALEVDGAVLTQSLAICEYLEETHPFPPLLPIDPIMRAKVRRFALVIACEVHPVQNLKVLNRLRRLGLSDDQVTAWGAETIDEGLNACAQLIANEEGPFCFGSEVSLADIFLVPQLVNARRFGVPLRWPKLAAAEAACLSLEAFARALPANQPDAE